jgi:hypothetical protein
MIAYYLSQPDLKARFLANGPGKMPMAVKAYLRTIAVRYKGAPADGIPLAALGDVIPCVGGTAGRPPIADLELDLPTGADPRTFATTQVTDGEAVVIRPLVSLTLYSALFGANLSGTASVLELSVSWM